MLGAKSFGEKLATRMREYVVTYQEESRKAIAANQRENVMLYTIVAATLEVLATIIIEVTA